MPRPLGQGHEIRVIKAPAGLQRSMRQSHLSGALWIPALEASQLPSSQIRGHFHFAAPYCAYSPRRIEAKGLCRVDERALSGTGPRLHLAVTTSQCKGRSGECSRVPGHPGKGGSPCEGISFCRYSEYVCWYLRPARAPLPEVPATTRARTPKA